MFCVLSCFCCCSYSCCLLFWLILLLLSFLFLLFHVRLFLRLMLLLLFLFLLFHVRLFLRCFCVLSCFCCCYCSCCLSFWLMLLLLFFVISRQIVLCCCCCCFFWCQIDVSSSEIRRPNWFRSFVANGGFRESKAISGVLYPVLSFLLGSFLFGVFHSVSVFMASVLSCSLCCKCFLSQLVVVDFEALPVLYSGPFGVCVQTQYLYIVYG